MAKRRKNQQTKAAAGNETQPAPSQPQAEQKPSQAQNAAAATGASNAQKQPEEAKQSTADHSCNQCSHAADNSNAFKDDNGMMVQPKFNISETFEVVHMGPAGQQQRQPQKNATNNQRFQQTAAKNPATNFAQGKQGPSTQAAPQKQGQVWNSAQNMNSQYGPTKRPQYPTSGKQVVTMHDLIEQEERQGNEQQKAQRQQAAQQAASNSGATPQHPADAAVEADEEDGEEESEEEDTEEEDMYGHEAEGQEDELSDEIEDEQTWNAQTQGATGAQYHQGAQGHHHSGPGGNHKPNTQDANAQYCGGAAHGNAHGQHYDQNASSQGQYQHHYQHNNNQGHPPQQQRSQAQQEADVIDNRLHQYLTDMLINLYNGKGTEEYRDHYAHVVTILDDKKKLDDIHCRQSTININQLQQLFQNKIQNIVGTVRDKLQEDAKKDNLVVEFEVPAAENADGAQQQDSMQAPAQNVTTQMKAKEYRGDLSKNFDEILSAVGDYFDLFKNNTDKLEALWLQLLDFVEVPNSNQCRIFRRMHYSIYIRTVIRNKTITAIIKEAQQWNGTAHASKMLKEHLDKIKQIENESHPIPETYEHFNKRAALDFDLNEYTRTDFMQKQAQLERQQSQNTMRQETQPAGTCNKAFQDCNQFQNHQRQTQNGKCMCRCFAKNCAMDHHFNKGQRAAKQTRGADKRQGKKFEAQSTEFEYSEEQVYNKNLDDLMDYIMQPQAESKKNKKKAKKRKGAADEEEEPVKPGKSQSDPPAASKGAVATTATATPVNPKKQNSQGSTSDKETGTSKSEPRSQSHQNPKAPAEAQRQASGQRCGSGRGGEVGTGSSDCNSVDEQTAAIKTDQEFEAEIENFARQLERNCAAKLVNHAKKLRPNYEEQWILKLKLRLQHLEYKKQHSATKSSSSSGKAAPASARSGSRKN